MSNPYLWNQTTISYSDASAATVVETVIAVKGDTGEVSTTPGPTGPAGAGFFRHGVDITSWPATSIASSYLAAAAGRSVVQDDVLTIFGSTVGNITETRRYDGSAWVAADLLVHGDMIATGTIAASRLSVTSLSSITADIGTMTAGNRLALMVNLKLT